MTTAPLVAVLIPARNEAADIERCLQAVLDQDHPRDRLEVVVVVDSASDDDTAGVAEEMLSGADLAHYVVHRHEGRTTPSNLNAGLALCSADLVCRVDARSVIPPSYVRRCAELLDDSPEIVVVGGAQVAHPRTNDVMSHGIARALNNRFGMGLARYRRGAASGPADTVYLGAFRTSDLRRVGGWDERFVTNQDFELNRRLGRDGIVWFDANLEVGYLGRRSLSELWRQYHRFGRWKVRYWRATDDRPRPRQVLLLAAPVVGIGSCLVLFRRRSTRPLAALLPLAGALALDAVGSSDPPERPAERFVAIMALGCVMVGWSTGVWREALGGRGS